MQTFIRVVQSFEAARCDLELDCLIIDKVPNEVIWIYHVVNNLVGQRSSEFAKQRNTVLVSLLWILTKSKKRGAAKPICC